MFTSVITVLTKINFMIVTNVSDNICIFVNGNNL